MHIYCPIKGSLFVHYIGNWILFLHIVSHLVMNKLHSFFYPLLENNNLEIFQLHRDTFCVGCIYNKNHSN